MPQRELASSMIIKSAFAPQVLATPTNSAAIDVTDGNAQTILFDFGTTIDASTTIQIQEDDGAGGWTDISPVQDPELDTKLYGQAYPTPPVAGQTRYAYVGQSETIRVQIEGLGTDTDVAVTVIAEDLYERANMTGFTV